MYDYEMYEFRQTQPCQGQIYVIQAGDTIYRISRRYGITVESILAANPGLDPDRLVVGQRICIPVPPTATCPNGQFYVIQAGDTLFAIAARFNTTVNAIVAANPGLDPNRLVVGQRICIPVPPTTTCPNGQIYTIQAGDTLNAIAARFNTTVNAILAANPGLDPNRLVIGQRICIPVPPTTTCPNGQIHTIQAGDTLNALAARFNTTVNAILAANPGLDPNRLVVGQRICIPVPPTTTCPGGTLHTIQAGDTIYALAQRYQVSVNEILAANPGLNPNALRIGQQICIPSRPQINCPSGNIYVIRPGDNLYAIAQRNGITLQALLNANPQITNPATITVGTNICIPAPVREE